MPGDSLTLLQMRRLVPSAQLDAQIDNNRRLFRAVTSARDSADAVARLRAATQEIVGALPENQRAAASARADQSVAKLVTPWMRYFLRYDSRIALRKVHAPVLALGGSLDTQVPASENLSGIDSALKAAGNKDYRVVELPKLNHLFQTATTGAPSEYGSIQETIAPQALELMASWINRRFSRAATPTAFLTTVGKDTFCLEQYSRAGNVITGQWLVLHPPGVYAHDYRITLADGGLPVRYTMRYTKPGALTPAGLDSLTVIYGRDTANLDFFQHDSLVKRRIALREGFPLLGQSFVGVELALMRLRRMQVDSSTIALHPPSDPAGKATLAPVRFFAGDSALIAGTIHAYIDADGRILRLRSGPLELKRVEPFEMAPIVDGFVRAFAPRVAAQAAAAAARVEIPLATAQLDRFAGEYTVGPATISITRDGEHLALHLPQQPAIQLMAMSQTSFFVREPDLVVTFDADPSGHVTGLTIQQGEAKQRFARKN
jgi:hypothetical protein